MSLDPIKLPERHENTPADCDMVLGQYMRAWNQLELATFDLFQRLLDANIVTASIIFDAGIDQRTMRSILDALGKQRLRKTDYAALARLLRRMKDAASIRNRLVHGTWQLNLVMGDKPLQSERAEWVRFYRPTDPEAYHQIAGKRPNQKLLAVHQFKLERIVKIARDVADLAKDVRHLANSASLLPARIPQPAF